MSEKTKIKYIPIDSGIHATKYNDASQKSELLDLLLDFCDGGDSNSVDKIFDKISSGSLGVSKPSKADLENHYDILSDSSNWSEDEVVSREGVLCTRRSCEVNGMYSMIVVYHGGVNEAYHKYLPDEVLDDIQNKACYAQQFWFNPSEDYVSSTATLAYCIGEVFAYGSLAKAVSILLQETVSEYATAVVARLRAGNVGPLNDEEVAEINLEAEAEAEVEAELDMVAFEVALDEAIVCDIAGGVIAGGICGVVAAGIFAVLDIAWHSIDKTYMVSHAMFNLSESSYTKFFKPYRDNVAEGEGQVPPILDDEKASKQSLPGAFTPLPPVPVSGHESSEHICDLLLSSVNHSSGKIHWGMFTVKNDNKFMEGLGYLFNLSSPEGYFVSSKYAVHFGLESNESDVKIQRGDFGAKSEYNNMGKTETFISEQIGESMDSCVYQGADNLGHSSDNSYRVVTVLADGSFS